MTTTADIQYTIIAADTVYTNGLTPVSAVPWPNRYEKKLTLPYTNTKFTAETLVWDFGDGTTYTGISAEHIYSWPGEYTITLTVIDETGNPVESTYTETISAQDFIPTQYGPRDLPDVIDIPSGRLVNPITVDFMLSWQNYSQQAIAAPQCIDGKQHLMNKGKSIGTWMCGERHPTYSTLQQPPVTEFPIYTFNLYASGAQTPPLNISEYDESQYGHLEMDWAFHSGTPTLSSLPLTSIDVTRFDPLTGATGDPNTYDLLYYKAVDLDTYQQTTATDPQGVFVGLSGNTTFYYRDDVTKCKDSRAQPIIVSVELDEKKLYDQYTASGRNNSTEKYRNNKPLILNNIKPRVNEATQLGITTIGVNELPINETKWENTPIHFTVSIQDGFGFNILDSTTLPLTSIKFELINERTGVQAPTANYYIEQVSDTSSGYFRGNLYYTGSIDNVMLKATTYYDQVSGYQTDAIDAWLNTYRPEDTGIEEYGGIHRYYYRDVIEYTSDQLYDNYTTSQVGSSLYVDTNGVISDVIVINPGENLTQPPKITVEDATGEGASLVPRFNFDGGIISDVVVLSGGKGYTESPTIYFTLADSNATAPIAQALVDYNKNVKFIAVQPPVAGELTPKVWLLEEGVLGDDERPPRVVELTSRGGLTRSQSLSGMMTSPGTPLDLKLDNNGDIYILTENKVVKANDVDLELENIYDDNLSGTASFQYISDPLNTTKLEVDVVNIYICNSTTVHKINKFNNSHIGQTTLDDNVLDVLLHYNDTLYILTTNNTIETVDVTSMLKQDTISLPAGSYNNLTTTVDSNIYVCKDNRYLIKINVDNQTLETVYDPGPSANITTICGDSRGYIWLPDDFARKIWLVDVMSETLVENTQEGTLQPGSYSYNNYPIPGDGITTGHTLRAIGDWTGFHWLQKFGIIRPGTRELIGYSQPFDIHKQTGTYNILKKNEDFNAAETIKSYATQPWLQDQHNLWDEAIKSVVGDSDSTPESIGKLIYEKISNFLGNNNDIDDCNIDSVHSHALIYDIDIQMYNLNYPPSLKRIMDLCSIKRSRLYGTYDVNTDEFDQFVNYTETDTRENLGGELDFLHTTLTPGQQIVAFEKFSKEYNKLTVTHPTSGNIDQYGNLVNIGLDRNLVETDTDTFPLSAYNVFWQWNLVAPTSTSGSDILNYYKFFKYNDTVSPPIVDSVIDWDNKYTLLTPTLSTYGSWSGRVGILENIIEHQLRVGLDLFETTTTSTSAVTASS